MGEQEWTGDDLRAWRQRMGYTLPQAGEAIGMKADGIRTTEQKKGGEIRRVIKLACMMIEEWEGRPPEYELTVRSANGAERTERAAGHAVLMLADDAMRKPGLAELTITPV